MEGQFNRLEVTLDPEHAGQLARIAVRKGVRPEALARLLLCDAIDVAHEQAQAIDVALTGVAGDARPVPR